MDESRKYLETTYELQSNRQTEQSSAVGIVRQYLGVFFSLLLSVPFKMLVAVVAPA